MIKKIAPFFGKLFSENRSLSKFVLLFQGRTGSSYITECMNGHPNVIMEAEVWGGWGPKYYDDHKLRVEYAAPQIEWLRSFYEKEYDPNIKAIGFKTKFGDVLDKRQFISYLRKNDIKIIHMGRRNIIKLVVSELNAERLFEKAGTWNLLNKNDRPSPFKIDIETFDAKIRGREQWEKWLNSYIQSIDLPTIKIDYEELLKNETKVIKNICDFLYISYVKTEGKIFKNTPDDLKEIILNYDELFSKYEFTEYEALVNEIINPKIT